MSDFMVYATGLVYSSVCTSLSDEEATARLNAAVPTGISSQWSIADADTFATGEPHPCPCPDEPDNRHLLFSC